MKRSLTPPSSQQLQLLMGGSSPKTDHNRHAQRTVPLLPLVLFVAVAMIVIAASACNSNRYSPLNSSAAILAKVTAEHDEFIDAASAFWANKSATGLKDPLLVDLSSSDADQGDYRKTLAIAIQTVPRSAPYLNVILWSLLAHNQRFHNESFGVLDLFLINAQNPVVEMYRDVPDIKIMDRHPARVNGTEKEVKHAYLLDQYDQFILAMKACATSEAAWCMIFEDDALPTRGFLQLATILLAPVTDLDPEITTVVKFYTTDAFEGFGTHNIWDLLIISPLLIVLPLLYTTTQILAPRLCNIQFTHSSRTIGRAIVILTIASIITSIICGRQHIIDLLRLGHTSSTLIPRFKSAYNVALAINSPAIPSLIHDMEASRGRSLSSDGLPVPIDIMLYGLLYRRTEAGRVVRTFLCSPSIVQHLGVASTHPTRGGEWVAAPMIQDSRFRF